jgi:serine/threonine protein kinase
MGIVHRDLKLENILIKNAVQEDGKEVKIMKIADFGISGVADKWNPEVDWGR